MRFRWCICLAFLSALLLTTLIAAQTKQDGSLSELGNEFTLVDSSQKLFEVNADYVLQPILDPKDGLVGLSVVPKYFFEDSHPAWSKPDSPATLSQKAYRQLLSRLQRVRTVGKLVQRGQVGMTMNSRTTYWDEYQKAAIERSVFVKTPKEHYSISWFTLWYLRPVEGNISSKESALLGHKVEIDGKWYWISSEVFDEVVMGNYASTTAAGPLVQSGRVPWPTPKE